MLRPLLGTYRFLRGHPLAGADPLQTLGRYLRWQVGSRLLHAPVAMSFVNDARLLVESGMAGATGNVYAGLHEFEDMAFLLHLLRPNDLFVDVGANIGSYTVLAAKAIGARVLCFEPVPHTFAKLRDNLLLNDIAGSVDARQLCVGRAAGEVEITVGLDTMNHVVDGQGSSDQPTLRVSQVTLDDALAGAAPALMKLDVEGRELDALAGASTTLADARLRALIVEVNDSHAGPGGARPALETLLGGLGFECVRYAPFERKLLPDRTDVPRPNAIFVRGRDSVLERLQTAPAFRVLRRSV